MKEIGFKQHIFDESIRLLTVIILVLFCAGLVLTKSELARDVVLLIIGLIGGKYLRT